MRDMVWTPLLYQPQSNGECRYAASAAASRGVGLFWYEIPALGATSENLTLPCWANARPAAAAHKHAARPATCRIRRLRKRRRKNVSMTPPRSAVNSANLEVTRADPAAASPGASDCITRNE